MLLECVEPLIKLFQIFSSKCNDDYDTKNSVIHGVFFVSDFFSIFWKSPPFILLFDPFPALGFSW